MKLSARFIVIALIVGIPAFLSGHAIWPDASDLATPSAAQLPFLIVLSAVESLFFGFGIAFIIFGWPRVQAVVPEFRRRTMAMFVAISWLLVSWWPHDNFHRMNGLNLQGLIYIDYAFHLTLIIAAVVIAYGFWKGLETR